MMILFYWRNFIRLSLKMKTTQVQKYMLKLLPVSLFIYLRLIHQIDLAIWISDEYVDYQPYVKGRLSFYYQNVWQQL